MCDLKKYQTIHLSKTFARIFSLLTRDIRLHNSDLNDLCHSFTYMDFNYLSNVFSYLETVFTSQACINASFLLANDKHYGCSSKHHGIDLDRAIRLFGIISELENNTIQELVRFKMYDVQNILRILNNIE